MQHYFYLIFVLVFFLNNFYSVYSIYIFTIGWWGFLNIGVNPVLREHRIQVRCSLPRKSSFKATPRVLLGVWKIRKKVFSALNTFQLYFILIFIFNYLFLIIFSFIYLSIYFILIFPLVILMCFFLFFNLL